MIHRPDPRLLARGIETLPGFLRDCRDVAEALIDTNRPFTRVSWWSILRAKTDHDRLRARVLLTVQSIVDRMMNLDDDRLRAAVIRATAELEEVAKQCRRCPKTNLENVAHGRPFVCHAAGLLNRRTHVKFRFRIDEKGQIIESR